MKLRTIIFVLLLGSLFEGRAADLVVQDGGPFGTYATIGAAVSAASDGDRIIINNRLDALPWTENIIINKSLTFVSAVDNQRFLVAGDYTVQHAPGREVTIIGMENTVGSIFTTANGSTSNTVVNINWCKITDGDILFDFNYFELNLASSEIVVGEVEFFEGMIVGNDMRRLEIYDNGITPSNDTIFVVGNDITGLLSINSGDHFFFVANNIIYNTSGDGITIYDSKTGSAQNVIKNNKITTGGTATDGISIGAGAHGDLYIVNNIIIDWAGGDYGINRSTSSTAIVAVSYNIIETTFDYTELNNIVNDGTNTIYSSTYNQVDQGTPGVLEYDLDLTRNDCGEEGGSYAYSNFHPIDGPSSKVFFLKMPRQIFIAQPNTVKGYSFDR